jgi:hypothetical protein
MMQAALTDCQCLDPHPTDSNRARWLNAAIWDLAQAEAQGDLDDMRSHVDPDKVK